MPYEVIVHDDGSASPERDRIYHELSPQISTLILNMGSNMGLNVSANRAVGMAQSDYVLFMNDDCFLTVGGFKKMIAALSHDPIGYVSPTNSWTDLDQIHKPVVATNNLGGGHAIAFRKKVWDYVGGWAENNTTGQSDNVFILKILRAGFFKGYVPNNAFVDVIHPNAPGYIASFGFTKGNDCSYPKIFGIDPQTLSSLNHKRRIYCQHWVDGERVIPDRTDGRPNPESGLNDWGWADTYFKSIIDGSGNVDWDKAGKFGHNKWTNQLP